MSGQPVLLELFAGTRCISKAFEKKGWKTYSVDWNEKFKDISLYADISKLTTDDLLDLCGGRPDVIWASPDCTSYSVAGIGFHRRIVLGKMTPISDYAKFCDYANKHLLEMIAEINPIYFFIENPRGGLRKMDFMVEFEKKYCRRYTVTYYQYGDFRQKPTDIWTNHPCPAFKPMCKAEDPCHERAPRHSRNGTQKYRKAELRAQIPAELCDHIAQICTDKPKVRYYTLNDFLSGEPTVSAAPSDVLFNTIT